MDVSSVSSAMAGAYKESIQATMLKTSQEIQGAAVLTLLASVAMPPVAPVGSLGHNVDIHA
ncbi:hypothetical protein [Piscirickettsia litoralis]|uniref:Motility protein n=1 Tax=Piscirickettsia litoralis TaxID=1891921 RepID=A0ABX3A4W0_9GAMM|nr:hypothetical protein [Piscirickettsia litoralis]ODN43901.1 hypothetical protein BGC07_14670 [Piscirickettsia litoralis]